MSTQNAMEKIATIKADELDQVSAIFERFTKSLESLTSDSRIGKVRLMLEECCKYWQVRDVFGADGEFAKSEGMVKSRRRTERLGDCQRFLFCAELDPNAGYLLDRIEQVLSEEVNRDAKEIEQTRALSREILETSSIGDAPVSTGNHEQKEQLDHWLELARRPDTVDADKVTNYLERVFNKSATSRNALEELRKSLKGFSTSNIEFSVESLRDTIKGLIAHDTLDNDKQATLREYLADTDICSEIADVLQMRIQSIRDWNWAANSGALRAYQRRKLNGHYRVFFDYDLIDAILWHAIGTRWCIAFKEAAISFKRDTWQQPYSTSMFENDDLDRRRWFLGTEHIGMKASSVASTINTLYSDDYFMSQLPSAPSEHIGYWEDEDTSDEEDDKEDKLETLMAKKQHLFRTIVADARVHQHLDLPIAVLCSDIKWFGPSISHTALFSVLRFFGVEELWLGLFKRYLEVPFQFEGHPVLVRSRGVPMSGSPQYFLAESMLFVLDYAFHDATLSNVFRIHDDIWAWGNPQTVLTGWGVINEFTQVFGLELNEAKTGSISSVKLDGLPTGKVSTGLVYLNKNFDFIIDDAKFDEHIAEMKSQIGACTTLMERVKACNAYAKYMLASCLEPGVAFGIQHIDALVSAFSKLSGSNSSIRDVLMDGVSQSTHWAAAPAGVWYWPINMGGLELFDPIVGLMYARQGILTNYKNLRARTLADELKEYEDARTKYNERSSSYPGDEFLEKLSARYGDEPFMPYEEYVKYARYFSIHCYFYFNTLEKPAGAQPTNKRSQAILSEYEFNSSGGPIGSWMSSYWNYIVTAFAPQLIKEYSSIQLVRAELVPLGLARAFAKKKQRWNT